MLKISVAELAQLLFEVLISSRKKNKTLDT